MCIFVGGREGQAEGRKVMHNLELLKILKQRSSQVSTANVICLKSIIKGSAVIIVHTPNSCAVHCVSSNSFRLNGI